MRTRNTMLILGTGTAALLSIAGTTAASAAATAQAPSVHTRQMGSCTASGDFAICEPPARTLNKPISITVHVSSRARPGHHRQLDDDVHQGFRCWQQIRHVPWAHPAQGKHEVSHAPLGQLHGGRNRIPEPVRYHPRLGHRHAILNTRPEVP